MILKEFLSASSLSLSSCSSPLSLSLVSFSAVASAFSVHLRKHPSLDENDFLLLSDVETPHLVCPSLSLSLHLTKTHAQASDFESEVHSSFIITLTLKQREKSVQSDNMHKRERERQIQLTHNRWAFQAFVMLFAM